MPYDIMSSQPMDVQSHPAFNKPTATLHHDGTQLPTKDQSRVPYGGSLPTLNTMYKNPRDTSRDPWNKSTGPSDGHIGFDD